MKNPTVKKHFLDPKNMGAVAEPTHRAILKSDKCSDIVKMTVLIKNGLIEDIKAQVYGCGYSIAGVSILTELVKGKMANEIEGVADPELKMLLPDVPEHNRSCIYLGYNTLKIILKQYSMES